MLPTNPFDKVSGVMGVKEVVVVVEPPDSLARLLKNMALLRGAYRKKYTYSVALTIMRKWHVTSFRAQLSKENKNKNKNLSKIEAGFNKSLFGIN